MTSLIKAEEFGVSVLASDDYRSREFKAGLVNGKIRDFIHAASHGGSVLVTLVEPEVAKPEGGES